MTQPFDQKARCEAAGELDESIGEFWLENPWQPSEHNLSAYERNRILINGTDGRFVDVSHACGGADMDSDSRSVVVADFNEDGMPDVLVRNSGGQPVRLFLNRFPVQNSIRLSLRGTRSVSRGIGARVSARIGSLTVHRELQSQNCFLGQAPAEIHLGLGDAAAVDELVIDWPSGLQQTFQQVGANQHYVAVEEPDAQLDEFSAPGPSSR